MRLLIIDVFFSFMMVVLIMIGILQMNAIITLIHSSGDKKEHLILTLNFLVSIFSE